MSLEIELFLHTAETQNSLFEELSPYVIKPLIFMIQDYLILPFFKDISSLLCWNAKHFLRCREMKWIKINGKPTVPKISPKQTIFSLTCMYRDSSGIVTKHREDPLYTTLVLLLQTFQILVKTTNNTHPLFCVRFYQKQNIMSFNNELMENKYSAIELKNKENEEITGIIFKNEFYPANWLTNPNIETIKNMLHSKIGSPFIVNKYNDINYDRSYLVLYILGD